jgi:hypothetical protein
VILLFRAGVVGAAAAGEVIWLPLPRHGVLSTVGPAPRGRATIRVPSLSARSVDRQAVADAGVRWSAASLQLKIRRYPVRRCRALRNRPRAQNQLAEYSASTSATSFTVATWRFRNNEDVRRRLWTDVVERKHIVIFIDDVTRNLARDDLAKETIPVHQ